MEPFAAKSHAEFLRMLRVREAVDDPPLVLMEDAVMPLAHREVEAEGVHEPTMRALQSVAGTATWYGQPRSIVAVVSSPFLRPMDLSH